MMGHPTRVIAKSTSLHWHPAGAVARVLIEWAERRDREQPLGNQDTLAEIQINREGGSIALLAVNESDVADLRRLLLDATDAEPEIEWATRSTRDDTTYPSKAAAMRAVADRDGRAATDNDVVWRRVGQWQVGDTNPEEG